MRNFSNETARDVTVRFCHGDPGPECNPGGTAHIGDRPIPLLRRSDGSETVSATWTAGGAGRQKIYAVIDPDDTILEVHDGDDLIDNNVAYASIQIGAAADADMGHAVEQPYDPVVYDLDGSSRAVAFYSSRASLSAVTRFELRDAQVSVQSDDTKAVMPFELVAYQGSKYKLWTEPIVDFSLRQNDGEPPAVLMVAYGDDDISGMKETELNLYRLEGTTWVSALCHGYNAHRFLGENLIAVPVCQTGVFALSDRPLPPLVTEDLFLPIIASSSGQPSPQQADLVPLELLVEPSTGLDTGTDVVLSVVLKNIGTAPAGENFWVDLFVNPARPPATAGDIWTALCPAPPDAPYECDDDLGLAWQVTRPVAPGEVIRLTSVAGVDPYLHAGQTQWHSHFNRSGVQELWVYVDAWNGPGMPGGWVEESNESNNALGPVSINVDGGVRGAGQGDATHRLIPHRPLPDQ